jgi:hypothetical protein
MFITSRSASMPRLHRGVRIEHFFAAAGHVA